MHIGALCSHGTKNNQHNSSTQPRTQPCTMSDGDICSDDERYGGFGAAMANSLKAYSAVPARVVAAVTAACAPLPVAASERVTAVRAPLPVAAAERVWKTKRPYKKRQKKSGMPAPAPQAAAPAEG
jgi:hypothetical protein